MHSFIHFPHLSFAIQHILSLYCNHTDSHSLILTHRQEWVRWNKWVNERNIWLVPLPYTLVFHHSWLTPTLYTHPKQLLSQTRVLRGGNEYKNEYKMRTQTLTHTRFTQHHPPTNNSLSSVAYPLLFCLPLASLFYHFSPTHAPRGPLTPLSPSSGIHLVRLGHPGMRWEWVGVV